MRYDVLEKYLKGEIFEPTGPSEAAWLAWATTYKPLRSPSSYALAGRRLNNFCIGSDPEFVFVDPDEGTKIPAIDAGLKVGLAAGADQNERLVELRPWPSVSVVTHVAGILTALRWMYRVYGETIRRYNWRAGAFYDGDGIGGHVHFGRKRPTRPEEVAALDGLAKVLKATGLFPVAEWEKRIRGDKLGQVYGRPGDFRIQKHGYEYRSLPSWLQSPVVAFIVLASSKLAVLNPTITTTWFKRNWDFPSACDALRGLAKLYKGRDDDAYILYHLLTQQGNAVFAIEHGKDFAPAWGLNKLNRLQGEHKLILPACIEPNEQEIREIADHLLLGIPLQHINYPLCFRGEIPENYNWVPRKVTPGRYQGFGDLIHCLVQANAAPIYWNYSKQDVFQISGFVARLIRPEEERMLREYHGVSINKGIDTVTESSITVPRDLCQTATIGRFRDTLLYSGIFPLWSVNEVQKDSYEIWLAGRPKPKEKNWRNL